MTQHILYSFASKSRPDKFIKAIANIITQSASPNFSIAVKLDNDDPTIPKYLSETHTLLSITGKFDIVFYKSHPVSKVDAINRSLPADGWQILINMSDDMRFITPGFDNIIRQHCTPDSFVHFPDGHVNRRLCTMSIMGEKYYRRFGYIYHPSYKSLWCDNEAQDVAKRLGKYKYVRQQIFEHQHHANGFGDKDALLIHTESFHKEDKENYKNRRRRGFPI